MRKQLAALAFVAMIAAPLGGCTTLASWTASAATDLSTSTPTQVSTFADATLAATGATKVVDLYVNTGNPDRAVLNELNTLNEALHAAWLPLKAANDANQSITFASFNAALAAFNSYKTSQGIKS